MPRMTDQKAGDSIPTEGRNSSIFINSQIPAGKERLQSEAPFFYGLPSSLLPVQYGQSLHRPVACGR